jgi:hypothetical protein
LALLQWRFARNRWCCIAVYNTVHVSYTVLLAHFPLMFLAIKKDFIKKQHLRVTFPSFRFLSLWIIRRFTVFLSALWMPSLACIHTIRFCFPGSQLMQYNFNVMYRPLFCCTVVYTVLLFLELGPFYCRLFSFLYKANSARRLGFWFTNWFTEHIQNVSSTKRLLYKTSPYKTSP